MPMTVGYGTRERGGRAISERAISRPDLACVAVRKVRTAAQRRDDIDDIDNMAMGHVATGRQT